LFPVIFAFGPIVITSLGVFSVLSFFFGGFFIWRKAKQEHIEDSDIFDLIFLSLVTGLAGGRLGYILSSPEEFGGGIQSWLDPVSSHGFAWFGFLAGWMLGVKWVCSHKKWSFFEIVDISVSGILISQILLRLGQFLDGSFVGSSTNMPWGVPFPGFESNMHPLSFYEIPMLFFLAWLVKYFDKHYRLYGWYRGSRGEAKPGFLWLTYLLGLTLMHLFLDFVFKRELVLAFISYRQLWLLGMLGLTIFWFWWQSGDSFDIWKLREKWFGGSEKPKIKNSPMPVLAKDPVATVINEEKRENEMQISTQGNSVDFDGSNLKASGGKRFFRSNR